MSFEYRTRIYLADTDAGGVVYHSRYIDIAERARTELLRAAIPSFSQRTMLKGKEAFLVKAISVDYIKPAFLDDEVAVITEVEELKVFSALLSQKIYRGEELLADIRVKIANVSTESGRPVRISPSVAEAIRNQ